MVEDLSWNRSAFQVKGNSVSGSLRIEGKVGEGEQIEVGVYPAKLRYRSLLTFLQDPLLKVRARDNGHFQINSLPPGRYRLAAKIDVNDNDIPEKKIDLLIPPRESPILQIDQNQSTLIRP
jgi:hypothetical protein